MSETPEPLVPIDVDLRGMPGFMLNVERLLASELVALCTPEEGFAALMLWCRAWQQSPPASLPDDDRVLARFSGAGSRWPKVKAMAMHGFVKCSDGRLYHPVLAAEALNAWKKRTAYKADQERLKRWREGKRNAKQDGFETVGETEGETRFTLVSEPEETGTGTGTVGTNVPSKERSRARPRSRFPADWEPSEDDIAFARKQGKSDAWIIKNAQHCRDHHAGKATMTTNPSLNWHTWVLGSDRFEGKGTNARQSAPGPATGIAAGFAEALVEREADSRRDHAPSEPLLVDWRGSGAS